NAADVGPSTRVTAISKRRSSSVGRGGIDAIEYGRLNTRPLPVGTKRCTYWPASKEKRSPAWARADGDAAAAISSVRLRTVSERSRVATTFTRYLPGAVTGRV